MFQLLMLLFYWNPPIFPPVVQIFDQIYQIWSGVWSQGNLQDMKFRSESKHLIFNVLWWECFCSIYFSLLKSINYSYFFKTLIRWKNIGFEFSLKGIFRRWIFRGDSKHFILNVFWWYHVLFHVFFSLELYQLFFLFLKTFIRCGNIRLEFLSKWSSEDWCSELIVITSFWMCSDEIFWFHMLFYRLQFFILMYNLSLIFNNKALMVLSRAVCVT